MGDRFESARRYAQSFPEQFMEYLLTRASKAREFQDLLRKCREPYLISAEGEDALLEAAKRGRIQFKRITLDELANDNDHMARAAQEFVEYNTR